MLYEGVGTGNTLGVFLPTFQPVTNTDVDQLMDLKIRMQGYDILFHLFNLFCSVFVSWSFVFTSNVLLVLPILLSLFRCLMIFILLTGSSLTWKPPRKWMLLEIVVSIYWLVAHFMAQLLMYHHRSPSPASFFESQEAPGKSLVSLRIENGMVPVSPTGTNPSLPQMEVMGTTYKTWDCMGRS